MLIKYLIIHPGSYHRVQFLGWWESIQERFRFSDEATIFRKAHKSKNDDSRPRPHSRSMRRAKKRSEKGLLLGHKIAFEKLLLLMLFRELFGFYADSDARKKRFFHASRTERGLGGCGELNDVHKNFMHHYRSCGLRKSCRKSATEMRVGKITFPLNVLCACAVASNVCQHSLPLCSIKTVWALICANKWNRLVRDAETGS